MKRRQWYSDVVIYLMNGVEAGMYMEDEMSRWQGIYL